jgi:hypothetical protein
MTKAEAIRLGQINSRITQLQDRLSLAREERRYLLKVVNKRKRRPSAAPKPRTVLIPYAGREAL